MINRWQSVCLACMKTWFEPQHHINQVSWHTLTIPALRSRTSESEVQGHQSQAELHKILILSQNKQRFQCLCVLRRKYLQTSSLKIQFSEITHITESLLLIQGFFPGVGRMWRGRVSLCSEGWSQREICLSLPPNVLGLKVCPTIPAITEIWF